MKLQAKPWTQTRPEHRRGTRTHRKYLRHCNASTNERGESEQRYRFEALSCSSRMNKKVIAAIEAGAEASQLNGRVQRAVARNLMSDACTDAEAAYYG